MVVEGFLLGLSTGTYCAMTCAPLTLPLLVADIGTHRQNALRVILFMLGRLLSYMAVGVSLGFLGAYAQEFLDPVLARRFQLACWILAGLIMTLAGLFYNFPKLKLCLLAARWWKPERGIFLLGVCAGLSLCPPFFAAAARVFGASAQGDGNVLGSTLSGAAYFLSFYLGTSVYLAPLFAVGFLGSSKAVTVKKTVTQAARAALLLLGLYFLVIEGFLGMLS